MFQYVRKALDIKKGTVRSKKLPELLAGDELSQFCKAVWQASVRSDVVMLKLKLFIRPQERGTRKQSEAVRCISIPVSPFNISLANSLHKRYLCCSEFDRKGGFSWPICPQSTTRTLQLINHGGGEGSSGCPRARRTASGTGRPGTSSTR